MWWRSASVMRLAFLVRIRCFFGSLSRATLSETATRMAVFVSKEVKEYRHLRNPWVEASYLPNKELRVLKKRFLKKDVPFVDVLAFPEEISFPDPEKKGTFLGDVYLNEVFKKGPRAERLYYLAHGVLHLLGYRHVKKSDTIEMEKMEQKLIFHFL
jgi:rRNA maturation RNase YbeY